MELTGVDIEVDADGRRERLLRALRRGGGPVREHGRALAAGSRGEAGVICLERRKKRRGAERGEFFPPSSLFLRGDGKRVTESFSPRSFSPVIDTLFHNLLAVICSLMSLQDLSKKRKREKREKKKKAPPLPPTRKKTQLTKGRSSRRHLDRSSPSRRAWCFPRRRACA